MVANRARYRWDPLQIGPGRIFFGSAAACVSSAATVYSSRHLAVADPSDANVLDPPGARPILSRPDR